MTKIKMMLLPLQLMMTTRARLKAPYLAHKNVHKTKTAVMRKVGTRLTKVQQQRARLPNEHARRRTTGLLALAATRTIALQTLLPRASDPLQAAERVKMSKARIQQLVCTVLMRKCRVIMAAGQRAVVARPARMH
jgi:hypothetical protein